MRHAGLAAAATVLTAGAVLVAPAPAAVARPASTASFPDGAAVATAPGGRSRLTAVDVGPAANGDPVYALQLFQGAAPPVRLLTFGREVDVAWSPSGRSFYVDDHMASDVSDCLVFTLAGDGVRRRSLTQAIGRSAGRPRPPEVPGRAHYYVDCTRWLSADRLSAEVSGHVDGPVREFDHPLVYAVRSGRVTWRRGAPRAGGRRRSGA